MKPGLLNVDACLVFGEACLHSLLYNMVQNFQCVTVEFSAFEKCTHLNYITVLH